MHMATILLLSMVITSLGWSAVPATPSPSTGTVVAQTITGANILGSGSTVAPMTWTTPPRATTGSGIGEKVASHRVRDAILVGVGTSGHYYSAASTAAKCGISTSRTPEHRCRAVIAGLPVANHVVNSPPPNIMWASADTTTHNFTVAYAPSKTPGVSTMDTTAVNSDVFANTDYGHVEYHAGASPTTSAAAGKIECMPMYGSHGAAATTVTGRGVFA